jgi:hypothetical protein
VLLDMRQSAFRRSLRASLRVRVQGTLGDGAGWREVNPGESVGPSERLECVVREARSEARA